MEIRITFPYIGNSLNRQAKRPWTAALRQTVFCALFFMNRVSSYGLCCSASWRRYLVASVERSKIGSSTEITTKPTINPMTRIIIGSAKVAQRSMELWA